MSRTLMFAFLFMRLSALVPACSVRTVDAMFKIFPGQELPPALIKPVAAARGELVHLQVLVMPDKKISAGTKITSAVVGLGNVTVRAVGYINMTLPENLIPGNNIASRAQPGLFPDALTPLSSGLYQLEHMTPGAPQVFWLSLQVPHTATPGLHNGTWSAGSACMASFSVHVFNFTIPENSSQLTGAQFFSKGIKIWSGAQCNSSTAGAKASCYSNETAFNFFKSLAAQRINSQVWFQLGDLPWHPTYSFNAARTAVSLNTLAHDRWWPKVLELTRSQAWHLPFSERVISAPHRLLTNATWRFIVDKQLLEVPIFNGSAGQFNPEFESMFRLLFGSVMDYLESKGWSETGSWIQVNDEPLWTENETLINTIAMIRLYKSVHPSIKVYQTRFPAGKGITSSNDTRIPPHLLPLLDLVDWWCPHVCQWVWPGVADMMTALRARKKSSTRPFHITVYDNGVPITESPWERLRSQALDVFNSNGTLDGTLSWYNINGYGTSKSHQNDPWIDPYPTPGVYPNGTRYMRDPAGWGYLVYPPLPSHRARVWAPVESIRWVMTGAGIQDTEYLYALRRRRPITPRAQALIRRASELATHFPSGWNTICKPELEPSSWGDDGYKVDDPAASDGSSMYNDWRLEMGAELDRGNNMPSMVEVSKWTHVLSLFLLS